MKVEFARESLIFKVIVPHQFDVNQSYEKDPLPLRFSAGYLFYGYFLYA
jgi:hypothetical protein